MTVDDAAAPRSPTVSEVASAYVDGEVGADQSAWVEANKGADAALAADLEGFARVKGLVAGLAPVQPGEGGWEQIGAGVRGGLAAQARRTWAARISAVAAALVVVAAIALGAALVVGRSVPDTAPQATEAMLTPRSTGPGAVRSGPGAVAAARGIGSIVERVGVAPRPYRSTTTTTSTRPVPTGLAPSR